MEHDILYHWSKKQFIQFGVFDNRTIERMSEWREKGRNLISLISLISNAMLWFVISSHSFLKSSMYFFESAISVLITSSSLFKVTFCSATSIKDKLWVRVFFVHYCMQILELFIFIRIIVKAMHFNLFSTSNAFCHFRFFVSEWIASYCDLQN